MTKSTRPTIHAFVHFISPQNNQNFIFGFDIKHYPEVKKALRDASFKDPLTDYYFPIVFTEGFADFSNEVVKARFPFLTEAGNVLVKLSNAHPQCRQLIETYHNHRVNSFTTNMNLPGIPKVALVCLPQHRKDLETFLYNIHPQREEENDYELLASDSLIHLKSTQSNRLVALIVKGKDGGETLIGESVRAKNGCLYTVEDATLDSGNITLVDFLESSLYWPIPGGYRKFEVFLAKEDSDFLQAFHQEIGVPKGQAEKPSSVKNTTLKLEVEVEVSNKEDIDSVVAYLIEVKKLFS